MNDIPSGFLQLIDSYNAPCLSGLRGALLTQPDTSIRFNPLKGAAVPNGFERVPWCDSGIYLPRRPAFTFDPAMHQGRYYVQEASSMFVEHVVRQLIGNTTRPIALLDACAAPGGKTTAAIAALPSGSTVVANEYEPRRCAVLRENIAKWGYPFVCVTNRDTRFFAKTSPEAFDIILADAPCSGEGMMRKEPEARAQWSLELVAQCAERQKEIVGNLWKALRPGGYLVYSTCTFNRSENEEVIDYITAHLGGTAIEIDTPAEWNISPGINTSNPCMRFIPGLTRGEGIFMAVVRKPENRTSSSVRPAKEKKTVRSKQKTDTSLLERLLTLPASFTISETDGTVTAHPHCEAAAHLPAALHPSFPAGHIKGRDIIPSQQLALSAALRRGIMPEADVDAATALNYLRGITITLSDTTPRGIVLLTYEGTPLGWVKNLGNRANNLYPHPWRVLNATAMPDFATQKNYDTFATE